MENYLKMVDFCDKKGIKLENIPDIGSIRDSSVIMGPDNDVAKLQHMFMDIQTRVYNQLPSKQKSEMDINFTR